MKRIKDFVYNFSDIFITLLVIAVAGAIIFWRVQIIMGYSSVTGPSKPSTDIDIDFSDIDLNVDPDPEYSSGHKDDEKEDPDKDEKEDPEGREEQSGPAASDISGLVVDRSFTAYKTVYVSIPLGATFENAVRRLASAFDDLNNEQYAALFNCLWERGTELGAEYMIQIDTFTIPEGTGIDEMLNIVCRNQLF